MCFLLVFLLLYIYTCTLYTVIYSHSAILYTYHLSLPSVLCFYLFPWLLLLRHGINQFGFVGRWLWLVIWFGPHINAPSHFKVALHDSPCPLALLSSQMSTTQWDKGVCVCVCALWQSFSNYRASVGMLAYKTVSARTVQAKCMLHTYVL